MKRNEVDRTKLSPMMKQYMEIKDQYKEELVRLNTLLFEIRMTDIIFIINKLFYESKINIELWSDVETVIELLVTENDDLKVRYGVNDLPKWNNETLKSFSEGLTTA